jgi:23S rRNA pseudouridine2604 synthase
MATLKLKKDKTASTRQRAEPRGPLRGIAAPRKQKSLAEVQAERAARAERTAQERRAAPQPSGAPRDRPPRRETPREAPPTGTAPARRAPPPPRSGDAPPRRERQDPARRPPRGDAAPRQDRDAPARRDRPSPSRASPPARREPAPRPAPPSRREPQPAAGPAREGDRLSKRMTAMGLASRREADDWIAAGWVRVDGKLAVLGQRIGPDARIDIDPRARNDQARRVTILLNKPVGYVSGQAEDGHEPAVVLVKPENRWADDRGIAFHAGHLRHLAPAGRLDIDSVGLLVLTQDGRVAKALIGEDSRIEKEYQVRVRRTQPGPLTERELALLEHGLTLDEKPLKPAKVSWANEDQLRFVLREGRKRQIRRMCELVGLEVLGLKRVRIGSVVLGKLPLGQWRYLRDDESF